MSKSVSLVLGSGGARGYAHVGVIEMLQEYGYEIKSISGSSMGALIGALYACGKLETYKEWVLTLDFFDCSISNPTKKISIPPVILNAGMVIPNNSKINFPSTTKVTTIMKEVRVAFMLILFLVRSSASSTNDKNIGTLAMGFMMAKNPVKTVIANGNRLFVIFWLLKYSTKVNKLYLSKKAIDPLLSHQ